jgi:hypothetical protein
MTREKVEGEHHQHCILMIRGINISLGLIISGARVCEEEMQEAPREEAMVLNVLKSNSLCIVGATEERNPTNTIREEEIEHTFTSSQLMKGEEENSDKMLTQWEQELNFLEDWLSNPGTKEYCPRDVVVKSEEDFQPEEKLENVGLVPIEGDDRRAEELEEMKLSEKMFEQQISSIIVEVEPTVEWQATAMGDKIIMGDQDDLPINMCGEEDMQQQRRLSEKKSHPIDHLDEEIEQIRRMMLKST